MDHSTSRLALGIDVSTTELRVTALDRETAKIVANAQAQLPEVTGHDGRRTQNADYAALALTVVDRALSGLRDASVSAISVTATSGTVVPVDVNGRQRGSAVMYNDGSGAEQEQSLTSGSGRPIAMLGRIMAMTAGEPDFHAASVAQVIGTALVGTPVAGDTSHFLKTGLDPSLAEWPTELLAESRLGASVLPSLVHPGSVLGVVSVGAASGALLIAAMTDGCTSQLAAGAVGEGQSVGVLGTTLVLKSVSTVDHWDAASGVYAHRAPDGRFWLGGASNVGGGSVPLPPGRDYSAAERAARALGPSPVVQYPLARRGERFPVADAGMEAFTIDLSGVAPESLDPIVAYRAGLEGVALVERLGLETLGVWTRGAGTNAANGDRLLSGGGTRNRLWNELRAASLGVSVRIPKHGESGYGAAVLAAWAAGDEEFGEVVARFTGGGVVIDPDPLLVDAMDERYAVLTAWLRVRS
jgi:xylulokinase